MANFHTSNLGVIHVDLYGNTKLLLKSFEVIGVKLTIGLFDFLLFCKGEIIESLNNSFLNKYSSSIEEISFAKYLTSFTSIK